MSKEININNVISFIQGYSRYYYEKVNHLPVHIKEQVCFRIYSCKDTCLANEGKCEKCGCPTIQKSYANKSCNPDKFPDMMSACEWEKYKLENKINNIQEIQRIVDKIINDKNQ